MAFLKVFAQGQERTIFLGDTPVVIGRDASCTVPLADFKVSRRHCIVEPSGDGRWRVRDLGSGNGTRVNGERVESHDLAPDDVVEVGDAKVLFAGEAAAVVAAAAPRRRAQERRPAVALWLGGIGLALGGIVLVLVIKGLGGKALTDPEEQRHYRAVLEAREDSDRLKFADMFLASYPRSKHAEEIRQAAAAARARLAGPAPAGYDPRTELAHLSPAEAIARLEAMLENAPDERRAAIRTALEEYQAKILDARESFFLEREAEFRAQVEAGQYARAREIWFFLRGEPEWEPIPPEYATRIVRANEDLGNTAAGERARLLDDEARLEGAHEFARAIALLEEALPRFKGTAVERSLRERLDSARNALRGGPASLPPKQSLVRVDIRGKVDALLARMPARDFAGAAAGLRGLADEALKQKDPGFKEIDARAVECEAAAALQAGLLAAMEKGDLPKAQVRKRWRVIGGGSGGLKVAAKGEEQDFAWADVPAELHLALLETYAGSVPRGWLGLAAASQALGSPSDLMTALARAYEDEASRAAVDAFVAARVRKEPLPDGGYVVHEGQLLHRREFLRRQEEKLIATLQAQLAKSYDAIKGDAVFSKLDRLKARKDELDKARAFALELIFDEQKYFYPYRGTGREGEYSKVQQEVDRRVRAVEEIWEDKLVVSVRAGAELERALKQFDDAVAGLRRCLVDVDDKVAEVDFLRSYLGNKFDLATLYRNDEERELLRYSREVMEANPTVTGDISEVEREQVRVTNLYRMMFGRQPVRIVEKLVLSSRGHCQEMSKLGYFGHFSPTPGRKTPWDRMKLQGYDHGVSENCIQGQTSPKGAHDGWCHSSGHHRNILMPPWTEMGTGHYGSLMTQNYGQAPKWSKDAPAAQEDAGEEVEDAVGMGEEGASGAEELPDYEEGD